MIEQNVAVFGPVCTQPIAVIPLPPGAPTCTLSFTPSSGLAGAQFVTAWISQNDADGALPSSCTGSLGNSVLHTPSGSFTAVFPSNSKTCTLTATNRAGESATCSAGFTVIPPPSTEGCIDIVKETFDVNGNPITPVAQFTFTLDGNQTATNDGAGHAHFSSVSPGTHTVGEIVPANWKLLSVTPPNGMVVVPSGSTCAAVAFKDQQIVAPQQATLIVTKVVINDDGGTKQVSDFLLFVDGVRVVSGQAHSFAPGNHTVSETNAEGYAATFGGDCDANGRIILNSGDHKACTISNNDIHVIETATLKFVKIDVNDNGGTKEVADFPLFVGSTRVISGVHNTFPAGAYTVSETIQPGYTATIDGDCDAEGHVTLRAGDSKVCTIVNNDVSVIQTAFLEVVKVVINDNGGTKEVSDFHLFVGTTPVISGAQNTFVVGTYTVSETNASGYQATFGGDCDAAGQVVLNSGDDKTCTITNNDIPVVEQVRLTVTKVVINDDGGVKQVADFPLFVGSTQVTSGEVNTFAPGSLTVSETNAEGYAATFSGDCDAAGKVTLSAGDNKACTITNDDIRVVEMATLKVVKIVVNDNGGTKEVADFPLFVGSTRVISVVHNTFPAGAYTVSETIQPGYTATIDGDCDAAGRVTLQAGDSKVCTIVNNDVPVTQIA